jgi:hypothetical protein
MKKISSVGALRELLHTHKTLRKLHLDELEELLERHDLSLTAKLRNELDDDPPIGGPKYP